MSNIRNIVTSAVSNAGYSDALSSYGFVVDRVVEALEQKAENVADFLVREGRDLGATEEQVKEILVQSGLIEPEPEPEPEVEAESDDTPAWAQRFIEVFSNRLDRLEGVARERGLL